MKLKQIKEFNNDTVTQAFAAEICALCIWNHYRDTKYKDKGFRIVNTPPRGEMKGGSTYPWRDGDDKRGYTKVATGVEIITALEDRVKIWENGHVMANWRESTYSEYEHFTRNIYTREEQPSYNSISITQMPEIVQLYLDYGFFTIEL